MADYFDNLWENAKKQATAFSDGFFAAQPELNSDDSFAERLGKVAKAEFERKKDIEIGRAVAKLRKTDTGQEIIAEAKNQEIEAALSQILPLAAVVGLAFTLLGGAK